MGPKVESLLVVLGLNRKSKEAWLSRVRGYYEEALFKMKKYFSASIKSKTLRALSVLSPKSWTNQFRFSQNVVETPKGQSLTMSPEDLLVTMREGKPSQRYKQDM